MNFIDTHCHLTEKKLFSNLDEILVESRNENIKSIISISDSVKVFEKNLSICNKYENIFLTIGIHPHYAENLPEQLEIIFEKYLKEDKLIAIGEIGLDFHYGLEHKDNQIVLLEKQLSIAQKTGLPIVIHSRKSDDEIFNILKNFSLENKIVMHCYSSDIPFAKRLLDNFNIYFSFNGILTFKNANLTRDVFNYLPLEKVIFETDAPYLTPVPFRGKLNKPSMMKYIYEKGADLKKISLDKIDNIIYSNCKEIFGGSL